MSTKRNPLLEKLKYHVTGAIERGEATAIEAVVKPKHTPGPWIIGSTIRLRHDVMDSNMNTVAKIKGEFENEMHANARLLAAAPELLEALELILNDDRLMNALSKEQARAVMYSVAKARGES